MWAMMYSAADLQATAHNRVCEAAGSLAEQAAGLALVVHQAAYGCQQERAPYTHKQCLLCYIMIDPKPHTLRAFGVCALLSAGIALFLASQLERCSHPMAAYPYLSFTPASRAPTSMTASTPCSKACCSSSCQTGVVACRHTTRGKAEAQQRDSHSTDSVHAYKQRAYQMPNSAEQAARGFTVTLVRTNKHQGHTWQHTMD